MPSLSPSPPPRIGSFLPPLQIQRPLHFRTPNLPLFLVMVIAKMRILAGGFAPATIPSSTPVLNSPSLSLLGSCAPKGRSMALWDSARGAHWRDYLHPRWRRIGCSPKQRWDSPRRWRTAIPVSDGTHPLNSQWSIPGSASWTPDAGVSTTEVELRKQNSCISSAESIAS